MINARRIAKKDQELVSRYIAGETIIVPIRGKLADLQRIFVVDTVAAYIWQQLDGRKRLDEILEDILAEFDVERERARTDLEEFIAELAEAGLVEELSTNGL